MEHPSAHVSFPLIENKVLEKVSFYVYCLANHSTWTPAYWILNIGGGGDRARGYNPEEVRRTYISIII